MEQEYFERVAQEQGWSDQTKVAVLLTYIQNQSSPEAFEDFIQGQVGIESACS